jgi:hypothetical protein
VIQGVQIELTTEQLRDHIAARAEHHRGRAAWYGAQVRQLHAGGVREQRVSNDPVSSLEGSQEEHQRKAALFAFLAEHLIPDETYRLSEHDFTRLEFVDRWY